MKIILILVLIVALFIGFRAYNNHAKKAVVDSQQVTVEQNSTAPPTSGKKVPFMQYAAQGGSYECTIHQYLSDMNDEGTVYVSNGNMKGSFDTVAEGKKLTTSFIIKDGFSYTWSSSDQIGVKMPIRIAERHEEDAYAWSPDQVGEYSCQPWTGTDASFTVPTNIKFSEIKAVPN